MDDNRSKRWKDMAHFLSYQIDNSWSLLYMEQSKNNRMK